MKHNFEMLIIKITGVCKDCEQYVESRATISFRELEQFKNNAASLREHKIELAYADLAQHPCFPVNFNKVGP